MSIFSKKRIIAIILFLAMILINVAASAGTVTVHVSVDQYVEIAFWLDGETAEAEAQEIISTLTFIHR